MARPWVVALVVAVLGWVAYAPSLGNGFALDDGPLASAWSVRHAPARDPVVGELHSPGFYFDRYYWDSEYVNDGLYRPVTIYSYAVTNAVSGGAKESEALPHHLLNVLLHGLAAVLVVFLLLRIRLSLLAAGCGGGLFAVHALHSEVVAGVVGRAELFAFVFGLSAVLVCARGTRTEGSMRHGWHTLAAVLFFCAYGSKESALAFAPFLFCVILAERWSRPQSTVCPQPLLTGLAVSGIPMAVFLWLRAGVMAANAADRVEFIDYVANPLDSAATVTRLSSAVELLGLGLYKSCAPFDLRANYGPAVLEPVKSFGDPMCLLALAVLLVFLVCGLVFAKRSPALFLAMASFLGLSFVTSNLPFATGTIFAERLYYAPSLGVCILGALLVHSGMRRQVVVIALAAWALLNLVVGWQRCGVWQDSATLYLAEAGKQDCRSVDMLVKLAGHLRTLQQRQPTEAREAFALQRLDRALELLPGYPSALREQASWHMMARRYDAAIASYQEVVDEANTYVELPEATALAFDGMASAYVQKGDKRRAVEAAQRAIQLSPADGHAWLVIADQGPGTLSDAAMRVLFAEVVPRFLAAPGAFGGGVPPATMASYLAKMGARVKAPAADVQKLRAFVRRFGGK